MKQIFKTVFLFYFTITFASDLKTIKEKNHLNHFLDNYLPNGISNIIGEYLLDSNDINFKCLKTLKKPAIGEDILNVEICELTNGNLVVGYNFSYYTHGSQGIVDHYRQGALIEIWNLNNYSCNTLKYYNDENYIYFDKFFPLYGDMFVMISSKNDACHRISIWNSYTDKPVRLLNSFFWTGDYFWYYDNKLFCRNHVGRHFQIDLINDTSQQITSDVSEKLPIVSFGETLIGSKLPPWSKDERNYFFKLFTNHLSEKFGNDVRHFNCLRLKDGRRVIVYTNWTIEIWGNQFHELMEKHKSEEPSSCCVIL